MSTITIKVYAHPDGESWEDIDSAVRSANGLQTHYTFALAGCRKVVSGKTGVVELGEFEAQFDAVRPALRGVVCCEEEFAAKVLVNEVLPHRIYLSCKVSKGLKDPPFRLYLLYQLASAALTLEARLSMATNKEMIHDPPMGCLWDWWRTARERSSVMVAARICPDCQNALRAQGGLDQEALIAAQQILDYVRRRMMGGDPGIANRIFIAYGHGDDWLELKKLVESWGLEVEHFNRESAAGVLVAERWRQMLNRARFAFAVMTPDDAMKDGQMHARQNVIHEIGLCHARLGLQSTAILIARGTESFTNVAGVNHIAFDQGRLAAVADGIRQFLEERGILPKGAGKRTRAAG